MPTPIPLRCISLSITTYRRPPYAALRYVTLPPMHPLHSAVKKCGQTTCEATSAPASLSHERLQGTSSGGDTRGEESGQAGRRVASSKESKAWAMEELLRVTLFSDGSLIDGKVGAAGLMMVDGVAKRVKGVQLGAAKRYVVYEARSWRWSA
ncbi:hypothetical protein B0H15DRAFT_66670 [Mycena belliarum]|uniref:Uncharacterized protein n=1 Tax=Mycena belliarum TaxID=1033014 RepID=A0AAD6XQC0_9AGAR|nr:hypothetical protein B0H15DRAFT_243057 [Mycena belliae]KAJ7095676.1 hypothetical protein B0H15DRAFT_66321 [Mycena belliae]KAJ7095680.1 hypothetical protein B0H15DRAFT_66487 [Mycena belliae]KAJ7095686.1 hypothetical protein B0H15DRAFT_66670 [Mycena belliae]